MKTKQLWKVRTMVSVHGVWAAKSRWVTVADFAELQSVLVEDDVISTKFMRDVEVVEDEPVDSGRDRLLYIAHTEAIATFVASLKMQDSVDDVAAQIRAKFGGPIEDEKTSKP